MTAAQRRNRDWINGFGSLIDANLKKDRAQQKRILGVMSDMQAIEVENAGADPNVSEHDYIAIAATLCSLAVDALAQATATTPVQVLSDLMTSPVVLQRLRDERYI